MSTETSTETNHELLINTIAARVPQIIADHAAAAAAHEEMIAAEGALLDRVIAIVRPAIQAVGDRPRISSASSGGSNGCNPWSETERADWRGLCTSDGKPGPTRDTRGDDNTGTYGGFDLFLQADGTWCELAYEGAWSRWQGAVSSWSTSAKLLTSVEVARDYDVDEIVAQLCQAVTAAGSREKATAKAKERAAKLAAVVLLLGA